MGALLAPAILGAGWVVFLAGSHAREAWIGGIALAGVTASLCLGLRFRVADPLALAFAALPWVAGAASVAWLDAFTAPSASASELFVLTSAGALTEMERLVAGTWVSQALFSAVAVALAMRRAKGQDVRDEGRSWPAPLVLGVSALVLGALSARFVFQVTGFAPYMMRGAIMFTPVLAALVCAAVVAMRRPAMRSIVPVAVALGLAATAAIAAADWSSSSIHLRVMVMMDIPSVPFQERLVASSLAEGAPRLALRTYGIPLAWLPALVIGALAVWRAKHRLPEWHVAMTLAVAIVPIGLQQASSARLVHVLRTAAPELPWEQADGFTPITLDAPRALYTSGALLVRADGRVWIDGHFIDVPEAHARAPEHFRRVGAVVPEAGMRWHALQPVLDRSSMEVLVLGAPGSPPMEEPIVAALSHIEPFLRAGVPGIRVFAMPLEDVRHVHLEARIDASGSLRDLPHPIPRATDLVLHVDPDCDVARAMQRIRELLAGGRVRDVIVATRALAG